MIPKVLNTCVKITDISGYDEDTALPHLRVIVTEPLISFHDIIMTQRLAVPMVHVWPKTRPPAVADSAAEH